MSASKPSRRDGRGAPELRAALDEVERLLDARARLRHARQVDVADPTLGAQLEDALEDLERAAAAHPRACRSHAERLAAVRARGALQRRAVPEGVLDGLYEDVRSAASDAAPWTRSRMSDAFLDAPRSLARWRAMATAACLLLAVGGGLALARRLPGGEASGLRAEGSHDLRARVLEPIQEVSGQGAQELGGRAWSGRFVHDRRTEPSPSVYVFYDPDPQGVETRRRLDSVKVRIFPVGAPATDVEQN